MVLREKFLAKNNCMSFSNLSMSFVSLVSEKLHYCYNDMIFTNKLSCEHRPCLFLHLLLHLGVNLFVDEVWIWVSTLVLVSEFID